MSPSRALSTGSFALLFAASAVLTVAWCSSMSVMDAMQMPGGWSMSMMWMKAAGQSWIGAGGAFLGMWAVMMTAMMLPALLPMLWRYGVAVVETTGQPPGRAMTIAAAGYFFIWTAIGTIVFLLGAALASIEMVQASMARVVPIAAGMIVLVAGVLQFTAWKAHRMACCRRLSAEHSASAPFDNASAWQHGLHLGLHCASCCGNLMLVLLVTGMMNISVMAALAAAITFERVALVGEAVKRATGFVLLAAGLVVIARAVWLG